MRWNARWASPALCVRSERPPQFAGASVSASVVESHQPSPANQHV
jgi:hypothetical protein